MGHPLCCCRWLHAHGRTQEAEEALLALCLPDELADAVAELQQKDHSGGSGGGGGMGRSSTWDLLRSPAVISELTVGARPCHQMSPSQDIQFRL